MKAPTEVGSRNGNSLERSDQGSVFLSGKTTED